MSLTITLSHDFQVLQKLQGEWSALQDRSESDGIYLSWEWVSTWWQSFGQRGDLWLLQARDENGRLIGLAPLMRVRHSPMRGLRWRQLEFIGTSSSCEHLDFIIEKDHEKETIAAFIGELQKHAAEWDVLRLSNVLPTSPTLACLRAMDIPWQTEEGLTAPFIALPPRWDDLFNALSRNKRGKQRRYVRHLDETHPNQWSFGYVRSNEELGATLEKLIKLHQDTWIAEGKPGAFGNPLVADFYRKIARIFLEKGWLRLYRLQVAGEIVAGLFAYSYRGRVYHFATGVDYQQADLNPGHLLNQMVLQESVTAGAREYDFLWGEEDYKYSWGAINRTDVSLIWFASRSARLQQRLNVAARNLWHKLKSLRKQPEVSPTPISESSDTPAET